MTAVGKANGSRKLEIVLAMLEEFIIANNKE
jgi:hypothetical protein